MPGDNRCSKTRTRPIAIRGVSRQEKISWVLTDIVVGLPDSYCSLLVRLHELFRARSPTKPKYDHSILGLHTDCPASIVFGIRRNRLGRRANCILAHRRQSRCEPTSIAKCHFFKYLLKLLTLNRNRSHPDQPERISVRFLPREPVLTHSG